MIQQQDARISAPHWPGDEEGITGSLNSVTEGPQAGTARLTSLENGLLLPAQVSPGASPSSLSLAAARLAAE